MHWRYPIGTTSMMRHSRAPRPPDSDRRRLENRACGQLSGIGPAHRRADRSAVGHGSACCAADRHRLLQKTDIRRHRSRHRIPVASGWRRNRAPSGFSSVDGFAGRPPDRPADRETNGPSQRWRARQSRSVQPPSQRPATTPTNRRVFLRPAWCLSWYRALQPHRTRRRICLR